MGMRWHTDPVSATCIARLKQEPKQQILNICKHFLGKWITNFLWPLWLLSQGEAVTDDAYTQLLSLHGSGISLFTKKSGMASLHLVLGDGI